MGEPVLIDLFCGTGGASMGYHRADDRLPKVRRISGTALARFAEASTHETYGWSLSRGWRGVIVIRRGPSTRGIPTRGHDVERYHDDDV